MDEQAEGPEQILLRHAAGDQSTLLFLAEILMQPNEQIPWREALIMAEVFAGLAATSGSIRARNSLAAVTLCRSDDFREDNPERAESIWWSAAAMMFDLALEGDESAALMLTQRLEERADAGCEESATLLNETVDALPPSVLTAARAYEEKVAAECRASVERGAINQ